ncbi:hypothetical protein THIOSC15_1050003 [uncultured Thiomicrorhabdus sp.]
MQDNDGAMCPALFFKATLITSLRIWSALSFNGFIVSPYGLYMSNETFYGSY